MPHHLPGHRLKCSAAEFSWEQDTGGLLIDTNKTSASVCVGGGGLSVWVWVWGCERENVKAVGVEGLTKFSRYSEEDRFRTSKLNLKPCCLFVPTSCYWGDETAHGLTLPPNQAQRDTHEQKYAPEVRENNVYTHAYTHTTKHKQKDHNTSASSGMCLFVVIVNFGSQKNCTLLFFPDGYKYTQTHTDTLKLMGNCGGSDSCE